MIIKRALVALAATLTITTTAANAQRVVEPDPLNSRPLEGATGVRSEQGRKGILLKMKCKDGGAPSTVCWPLLGGTPILTIGGTPISCTAAAGLNPTANACGYVIGAFTGPTKDTFKIIYNGNFPAGPVKVDVTGATGSGGAAELTCPSVPGGVLCTLSFTDAGNTPRDNASVDLVFDISGSMALPSVPGAGRTRIQALKGAANFLFLLFPGHVMLGDKLGATFFSTMVVGGVALLQAIDPNNVDTVQNTVQIQQPTNSTSIGAGLNQANSVGYFLNDPNPNKVALLFSDGDQNTAPLIDVPVPCPAGTILKVDGNPYPTGIKVCPITTGNMTVPGFTLQQCIGQVACNNNYLYISSGSDTFAQAAANMFFVQALNSALVGDKLEIVREIEGTLPPGATQTETFRGNKGDLALTVLIAWSNLPRGTEINPAFRLIAPDGTEVETGTDTRARLGSSATTLHFPLRQHDKFIDPRGQWKIELQGLPTKSEAILNYQIIVVADNPSLASEARALITDPGTGEPISLEVKLTEDGAPIPGATVVAALQGPQNGLGDSLAKAANPQGAPNLNGDLAGSAARAKLDKLLSDPAFAALLKDQSLPSVTLTADASGAYRGAFGGATKEGHYQFAIVEAGVSTVGDFERTQRLTVFVRPKPVATHTDLRVLSSTLQPDNSVTVKLRAIARDRFGSMIGPDYGTAFQIRSSIGTIENPLDDTLDGGYDIGYRLPSDSVDPVISVVVMGDEVKSSPLSDLPGSSVRPSKNYIWLIIIIAILVLVILALLIYRRSHP